MIMDNSNVKDPYYLITQTPPNPDGEVLKR